MDRVMTVWQPLYYPRLHYLARLAESDVFVVFDDAEFTRSSPQQRAPINFQGKQWLTVPIERTETTMAINEAPIDMSQDWTSGHLGTLQAKYGGKSTNMFGEYYEMLHEDSRLSDLTIPLLKRIIDEFDIELEFKLSSDIDIEYTKGDASSYNARLTDHFECDTYYCGQNAYDAYLDRNPFEDRGIDIKIQDWDCPWPAGNSICLDVLFSAPDPCDIIV